MSASLPPRSDAVVLPSLPPSPSLLDEVFSYPRPWSSHRDESDMQGSRGSSSMSTSSSRAKGKEKRTAEEDESEDDEDASHGVRTHESYPPMTDQVAETRRVEETLKRWELAERRRRKSARESTSYASGPSLLSSVTRTASLVLSGRSSTASTVAVQGGARTFKSQDAVDVAREGYAVPLDDIDRTHSSMDIAVHSPSPSSHERHTSTDTDTGTRARTRTSDNPFEHPSERTRTSVSSPSPSPSLSPSPSPSSSPTPKRTPTKSLLPTPTLLSPFADAHAAKSKKRTRKRASVKTRTSLVPPPRPLGLPPPPEDVSHATPPRPTPQPVLRPSPRGDPEERQEVRWWHEWLCGCGEGPDRGGDNQAGRTNPFE